MERTQTWTVRTAETATWKLFAPADLLRRLSER